MDDKNTNKTNEEPTGLDFVRRIIEEDNRSGKWAGRVATRFCAGAEWVFAYRACE